MEESAKQRRSWNRHQEKLRKAAARFHLKGISPKYQQRMSRIFLPCPVHSFFLGSVFCRISCLLFRSRCFGQVGNYAYRLQYSFIYHSQSQLSVHCAERMSLTGCLVRHPEKLPLIGVRCFSVQMPTFWRGINAVVKHWIRPREVLALDFTRDKASCT